MNISKAYAEHDVYWTIVDRANLLQNGEGLYVLNVFWGYVLVEEQRLPGR